MDTQLKTVGIAIFIVIVGGGLASMDRRLNRLESAMQDQIRTNVEQGKLLEQWMADSAAKEVGEL